MPWRMASLYLPSPLAEKSEHSAWSEDIHVWCRQLSVQNLEETMCPQEKKTQNMTILTIMVFYQNNWSNWSNWILGFTYFMLSLFLVFICLHKLLKKEKKKCFPLAVGIVVKWPAPGKWWVFLQKILPGKTQSKYETFWALGNAAGKVAFVMGWAINAANNKPTGHQCLPSLCL